MNYSFVETTSDTPGYINALHRLQTTGNPVDPFRMPTYSFFMWLVFTLTGQGNLLAVSIMQGILFVVAVGEIYILTLLILRNKWLAWLVGFLVGTNIILIAFSKPIMTEGLSLWLLTTTILGVVLFAQTQRWRYFWLSTAMLVFLLFTRPEWILFPCLLYTYLWFWMSKTFPRQALVKRIILASGAISLLICGYIVANDLINSTPSLSSVSYMNLIGKLLQYKMQDETPYNLFYSRIFDSFVQRNILSPFQIVGHTPALQSQTSVQGAANYSQAIILHHPWEFFVKSIPYFFTSLYRYFPVAIVQTFTPGPFDMIIQPLFAVQRALYLTNILFPFCALLWLVLCCHPRTRYHFMVQAMGLIVLTVSYAVMMTTLGGYTENDYMRVHIVFDPLIMVTVWGTLGLGVGKIFSGVCHKIDITRKIAEAIREPIVVQ
jgi:hypothetical protein